MDFDIIGVAQRLGLIYIKPGPGAEEVYRCPFCGDSIKHRNKGHLYINTVNNIFKCQRCGTEGNAVTLWSMYYEINSKEAYMTLKDEIGPLEIKEVKPENPAAGIEKLDKVYRTFLGILKLARRHKDDLLSRGFTEKQIHDRMFKSIPGAGNSKIRRKIAKYLDAKYGLEGVPGFFTRSRNWDFIAPRGYLIPVKDEHGRIQALQMRLDEGDEKYKWFSSNGKLNGTSPKAPAHYSGGSGRVWITEGPLKADAASVLMNTPFIGVPGVNSWKKAEELLKNLQASDPVIAFDSDARDNPNVKNALEKFLGHLRENGYNPQNCSWPKHLGKGVDDVLLKLKKEEQNSVTFLVDGVPVTIKKKVTTEVSVG
ncbi:MAG: DUF3854 domain-containing protein [Clostridiales bacterium]|nr:DUF3854 domain-containing protein [Clostridiales bacterium]MCF8022641.1 DUF3854 domain-containing protein [Clostridiales bacterium]